MIRFDIHNEKIISRCAWMQPDMALGNDKAEISPDGKYICVGVGDALQVFDCGLKKTAEQPTENCRSVWCSKGGNQQASEESDSAPPPIV